MDYIIVGNGEYYRWDDYFPFPTILKCDMFISLSCRVPSPCAENGGYPSTKVGDVRSLLGLFSPMVK